MRYARLAWLGIAAACFVIAVQLSSASGAETASRGRALEPREAVVYPREAGARPRRRSDAGHGRPKGPATSPASSSPSSSADAPAAEEALFRAVPAGPDADALFFEFNAIRHSSIIDRLLACRAQRADVAGLDDARALGIDWERDIDRIALGPDLVALSGHFAQARWPTAEGTAYGDEAMLFAPEPGSAQVLARVGPDLILLARDRAAAEAAIDRVEGRAATEVVLPAEAARLDAYGSVSPAFLRTLLGETAGQPGLLEERLDALDLRMVVDDHLSVSLDVQTQSAGDATDLAKLVGGALAAARRDAVKRGDADLAWLLEQARVLPLEGDSFGVDVAVPEDWLLERLGCAEEHPAAALADLEEGEAHPR